MITKILFTAAVIAIVYLFASQKTRARGQIPSPSRREALPKGTPAPEPTAQLPRYLAYALLGIMLLGSGSFIFLEWRDQYRVVSVKVVNTNTGRSETFRARRGDVEDRAFETLDGRRVVLSDVERLELSGTPSDERP